jgi:hypothetical protein
LCTHITAFLLLHLICGLHTTMFYHRKGMSQGSSVCRISGGQKHP